MGDSITYTFTYGNRGNTLIDSVKLTDVLPDLTYITFVSASENPQMIENSTLQWELGSIRPNETISGKMEIKVSVDTLVERGTFDVINTASLSVREAKADSDTTINPYLNEPILKIDIEVKHEAEPGEELTYTYIYTNEGTPAINVVIVDELPKELIFVDVLPSENIKSWEFDNETNTILLYVNDLPHGVMREDSIKVKVLKQLESLSGTAGEIEIRNNAKITDILEEEVESNEAVTIVKLSQFRFALSKNKLSSTDIVPGVRIGIMLQKPSDVAIEIYTVSGQKVKTIFDGKIDKCGIYVNDFTWDGTDDNNEKVSSGVYIVVLKVGYLNKLYTKKLIVIN